MSFSSSTQINRIATLLASGLNQAQVSSIVNVSPSRIAQITATDDFKLIYADKKAAHEKEDVEKLAIAAKYLSAEHALLDHVISSVPNMEAKDATNALRIVAERQDKAAARINPVHGNVVVHQNIVQLTLPTHAVPEILLNSDREVIAIDNKTLAPLSSDAVTNLFKHLSNKENENVQARLPDLTEDGPSCTLKAFSYA
jgi:hypothetical protein